MVNQRRISAAVWIAAWLGNHSSYVIIPENWFTPKGVVVELTKVSCTITGSASRGANAFIAIIGAGLTVHCLDAIFVSNGTGIGANSVDGI